MLVVEIIGHRIPLWIAHTGKNGFHATSLRWYAMSFKDINEAEDAILNIKKIERYSGYSYEIKIKEDK